jgi:hypothetical protein
MLLLTFPEMKNNASQVMEILSNSSANEDVLNVWRELVAQDIEVETEDEDLDF